MKRLFSFALTAALGCALWLPATAGAQGRAPAPLEMTKLADGVYCLIGGSGANTGVVIGKTEVIAIDAKMTEDSAQQMLAEIAKVTPHPVSRIILTHSDGDHVNGLVGFPKGLPIIAHENARKDMDEAAQEPDQGALRAYLPTETVTGNRDLNLDGLRVQLLYFGPAHTDGDLVVFLPDQRVAFVGDLLFLSREPLIHAHKNGSSIGLVKTLNGLLALDADTYASGHNPPCTKDDIRKLLTSIEERQAKVKAMVDQGKTLAEVKTAFGVQTQSRPGAPSRPGLIEIIYRDMSK